MTWKKEQAAFATKGRSVSTSVTSEESISVTTQSKAKTVTMLHATSKLLLLRTQDECQRRELVISLAYLRAPKHVSATRRRTARSDEWRSSASKNSDTNSSMGLCHGLLINNHHPDTSSLCCNSSSIQAMASMKPQVAPMHAEKNLTSFATKHNLVGIVSRSKMNATRHTTLVTFPPKSYEGHHENQPAINFINRSKSKATVAMTHPSKSCEVCQTHKQIISITSHGAKKLVSRSSEMCSPKSKNSALLMNN